MLLIPRLLRYFAIAFIFAGAVTAVIRLPSQHLPWGPIDLSAPVGLFTGHKLAKLRDDPAACQNALRLAGIQFRSLPNDTESTCPRTNMVVLHKSLYPYSASVTANCGLVAALSVWEKQVVEPAALLQLQSKIKSIDHLGVFSCRNVRGSSKRQSQHATARAIDIKGFRLENGKNIKVKSDWGKNAPEGRFLRDIHEKSCPIFRGVLGPEYNHLHADHFHFDLGPYNICR